MIYDVLECSDIPVLKIISVLVSIKFEINHFSISFYTLSEFFSVLVSIKFLSVPLLYHSMGQIIKSVFFVCVCMYVCMCVSVGTLTVAFFNRSSRNLVRTFGV